MKNPNLWQVPEVKLVYYNPKRVKKILKITTPKEAEKIFRANWSNDIELLEESVAMFLSKANQVKGLFRISRGGVSGTVIDPKILFSAALKGLAGSVIIAHNHPSGQRQPSQNDIQLTKKLKKAGELVDIPVVDHIILMPHKGFYSFANEGLI